MRAKWRIQACGNMLTLRNDWREIMIVYETPAENADWIVDDDGDDWICGGGGNEFLRFELTGNPTSADFIL